jgi:broad specificity phosphatase PhoE
MSQEYSSFNCMQFAVASANLLSAGTTDSPLTTHGVLQASRLGSHLASADVQVSYIFSSDLQRAFKTAEAIRLAQPDAPETVTQLQVLREQDFGFYEGKHFYERPKGGDKSGRDAHREAHLNTKRFQDVESKQSMIARVEAFLDGHLVPLFPFVTDAETVAVVAHGIILTYLWRGILARFHPGSVAVAAGVMVGGAGLGLEYLGGWSNTGYLDLEIKSKGLRGPDPPQSSTGLSHPNGQNQDVGPELKAGPPGAAALTPNRLPAAVLSVQRADGVVPSPIAQRVTDPAMLDGLISIPHNGSPAPEPTLSTTTVEPPSKLLDQALVVKAVNSQEHLKGLKKTRGGIGSSKHDEKQKTVDSFFKRQKLG